MPTPFMTSFKVSKIFITFEFFRNKGRHDNNNNGGTRFCLKFLSLKKELKHEKINFKHLDPSQMPIFTVYHKWGNENIIFESQRFDGTN